MEELRAVQSPMDMLEKLTSITAVQTKGRKRVCNVDMKNIGSLSEVSLLPTSNGSVEVNTTNKNSRKVDFRRTRVYDPNIVGYEVRTRFFIHLVLLLL